MTDRSTMLTATRDVKIPKKDTNLNLLTIVSPETDKTGELKTHRDGDVVLRDGSTVRIRVMKPTDEAGLLELLQSLSEESRWLRFYSLPGDSVLAAEAHREANL